MRPEPVNAIKPHIYAIPGFMLGLGASAALFLAQAAFTASVPQSDLEALARAKSEGEKRIQMEAYVRGHGDFIEADGGEKVWVWYRRPYERSLIDGRVLFPAGADVGVQGDAAP